MDSTLPSRRSSEMRLDAPPSRHLDMLHPGEVLGDTYEIRGKLGEGGMGQVYEAYDRRLDRRVAIKVALRGLSVSAEARALAALRGHPSIVTVHALGVHRGIEYAVMDRIHGITLEERLERAYAERAPLGIAEVVRVGAAVAEGLAVVHAAGMAHRDVKPGNVILAPDDRIVITDFGIFQPECEREESTILWGTPEYMAPEASCGQIVPGEMFLVDVYALGVVLFEMLTGSVPFHGGSAAHVMSMHLTELVPDPRVTRPDAPRELAALVRGLMAKAPRARPQGMREIAWQLRHLRGDVARRRGPFSTLIAEDNPATAAILASLVGEGARDGEIRVARDGREALEMVQERPPDLLVVDLHLPVMSGLELCARLAETELVRGCKIVGTSAMAETGELAALQRLGCVRYLSKGAECSTRLPRLARDAWARAGKR